MGVDYKSTVSPHWQQRLGWDALPESLKELIGEYGLHMYGLGKHVTAQVEKIKYEGRLVILDDDSRWEVDPTDAPSVSLWSFLDKVVVIDGTMYNLEGAATAGVEPEY